MTDTRKYILIVDDEDDVRMFLQTLLEDNDYETQTANDGDVAYKMCKERKPDLITLDLQMPHETGTRFYRSIMKNENLKDVPVIVISGLAGRHLAVSEAVAVFDKPVDKDELLEAVKKALA